MKRDLMQVMEANTRRRRVWWGAIAGGDGRLSLQSGIAAWFTSSAL